jgi:hypothetical protein
MRGKVCEIDREIERESARALRASGAGHLFGAGGAWLLLRLGLLVRLVALQHMRAESWACMWLSESDAE